MPVPAYASFLQVVFVFLQLRNLLFIETVGRYCSATDFVGRCVVSRRVLLYGMLLVS